MLYDIYLQYSGQQFWDLDECLFSAFDMNIIVSVPTY